MRVLFILGMVLGIIMSIVGGASASFAMKDGSKRKDGKLAVATAIIGLFILLISATMLAFV